MPHRSLPLILLTTALSLMSVSASASEPLDSALAKTDKSGIAWYDIKLLDIEGQGWTETKSPFDRLPAKAEGVVRKPVWSLSRHSAWICARFISDATTISVKWELTSGRLAMPHMPATGVSGVDLYVKTEAGQWRWASVGFPKAQSNNAQLITGIPEGQREYLLYLPLYNGVKSVEIGIPAGKTLAKAPPRKHKPIVFYGTSITHGGCASRPGMVHTAILGRRLDHPVINLGFSGNGTMDPEMGDLMAELDPAVYVIDCLPNMNSNAVSQRIEPLVQKLRKARPETPILLVEDRTYSNTFLFPSKQKRHATSRRALRQGYDNLVAAGVKNIHYLKGDHLLSADGNDTVDGSHPTDLGFIHQADAFEVALKPILLGQ